MDKEKKKKTPEAEQETKDVKDGAELEKENDAELPETVTLSHKEFIEVKEHIEKLQSEKDDTVALAQRLQADFDNYRRRNASLRTESVEEGARNLIREMLPVLDNFDRAMEKSDEADKAWTDGIKLVYKQLMDVLKKNGLAEIPSEGKFDPELHEAVMRDESEGVESGMITGVMQKGYKVNDRIIRHSMVKVAK